MQSGALVRGSLVVVACVGCGGGGKAAPDAGPPRADVGLMRPSMIRDVDLLFVLNDGPSTLDKQNNLKANFPAFLNTLNEFAGGFPNVHIGVVTTDLGTSAAGDATPGPSIGSGPGSCSGTGKNGNLQTYGSGLVSGTFISDTLNTDGTRTTNYTGSLASAFSAIASAGSSGCGFQQDLRAAQRALDNNPMNAGFLRPDAALAIIDLTDEDDCSAEHTSLYGTDTTTFGSLTSFRCTRFGVTCFKGGQTPDAMNIIGDKDGCGANETSPYVVHLADELAFFRALKTEPRDELFAGIVGPPTPVTIEARSAPGSTTPVPALQHACSFTNSTGSTEVADPAVRLAQFASMMPRGDIETICQTDLSPGLVTIARSIKNLLGEPCLVRDIAMPADCAVTDDATGAPLAFTLAADPATCPDGQHLRLQLTGAPAGTWARVRCVLP